MYLTHLARVDPKRPCTAVLEESEWKSVGLVRLKQPLPPEPPTLERMLRLVAQLGGYNGRAKEGPPGPQSIWVGLRRMTDFALAFNAIHRAGQKVVCK